MGLSQIMLLFEEKRILTVSQLTALVRGVIEENFDHIWVEGEVSNLATPGSGHLYFTLKDSAATIRCVMFKGAAKALKFRLQDGMRIIMRGRITVYDQRGEYQILAEYLEPQGLGALQLAFQQLKERLAKEGLFRSELKKTIPMLPKTVGVVTSPTGAAVHDILNVIGRRHGSLHVLIYPVRVQGEGAAADIAEAIRDMNRLAEADVIIVGRGGGSLEDLWAFNEEVVARAIFASKIPVISAVGHEVDITIADLAADLRAPTPSAAAELVSGARDELLERVHQLEKRLSQGMQRLLDAADSRLEIRKVSLKDPKNLIERFMQRIDDLDGRLEGAILGSLEDSAVTVEKQELRLSQSSPRDTVEQLGRELQRLEHNLSSCIRQRIVSSETALAVSSGRLDALSPLAILARGYTVALKLPEKKNVRSVSTIAADDKIELVFHDGKAVCTVNNIP